MAKLMSTVKAIRSQLSALNVASNAKPTICIRSSDAGLNQMFASERDVVQSLVKAGETIILAAGEAEPEGCVSGFVSDEITIFVKVIGLIDIKLEMARIAKRTKQLEDFLSKLQQKMAAPGYDSKVPAAIQQDNIDKCSGYVKELAETAKQMDMMTKLQ